MNQLLHNINDEVVFTTSFSSNKGIPCFSDPSICLFSKKTAELLRHFLERIDFLYAQQTVMLDYGQFTVFELNQEIFNEIKNSDNFKKLNLDQQLAVRFLMFGGALTVEELYYLMSCESLLISAMKRLNLLIENEDATYRLNDLSIAAFDLNEKERKEVVYILVDLPQQFSPTNRETDTQIACSTIVLIDDLRQQLAEGMEYEGIGVDFGSGTGVQSIAILKMFPKVDFIIAAEINANSMNLASFNIWLNGVHDNRYVPIDNSIYNKYGINPISEVLGDGKKLNFVVTNPPINLVPDSLEKKFTPFGFGGADGSLIIREFFEQALPLLDFTSHNQFIFLGDMGVCQNGSLRLINIVKNEILPRLSQGLELIVSSKTLDAYLTTNEYSEILLNYVRGWYPDDNLPSVEDIAQDLKECEIIGVQSNLVKFSLVNT